LDLGIIQNPKSKIQNAICLAAIALGWVALLLLIPPQHEYPIIDDWIYARSVQHQVATGAFAMPAQSQASLVGLTLWGTLWVRLFGFSFTVLTYSTLVLALAASYAFYGIAREAGAPPPGALLGTGLLALNPIFFHLSYSFMTDVPFMCLLLLSSYCYMQGLKPVPSTEYRVPSASAPEPPALRSCPPLGTRYSILGTWHSELWLLLGGVFAGYSFLVRQFGVLLPVGFLLYLVLDGIVTRRWRWRQMIAVVAVPALVIGGWYIWSHDMPPSAAASFAKERSKRFLWNETWLPLFLERAAMVIPLVALFAWTAVKIKRGHLPFLFVWGGLITWAMFATSLPKDSYSFAGIGNIVRFDGLDFFEYQQEPLWTPDVWKGLTLLGAALSVPVLAQMSKGLLDWMLSTWRAWNGSRGSNGALPGNLSVASTLPVRKLANSSERRIPPRPHLSPITGFYLVGAGIFIVSLGLLAELYDRYSLGFLPFVILFLVRSSSGWGRLARVYAVAAFIVVATFTLVAKVDFIDHNNARWQAGAWFQARAPLPVEVGYDWNNWYGFSNLVYQVTDLHIEGFRTERRFPYFSRLAGFTTRYVLAESRADTQPLSMPGP
jgi:4-amino-4-deoxy-L-arabinose transferase-like glycosyltransferase